MRSQSANHHRPLMPLLLCKNTPVYMRSQSANHHHRPLAAGVPARARAKKQPPPPWPPVHLSQLHRRRSPSPSLPVAAVAVAVAVAVAAAVGSASPRRAPLNPPRSSRGCSTPCCQAPSHSYRPHPCPRPCPRPYSRLHLRHGGVSRHGDPLNSKRAMCLSRLRCLWWTACRRRCLVQNERCRGKLVGVRRGSSSRFGGGRWLPRPSLEQALCLGTVMCVSNACRCWQGA